MRHQTLMAAPAMVNVALEHMQKSGRVWRRSENDAKSRRRR